MDYEPGSASQSKSGLAQRLKEDGRQTIEQRKRSAADRIEEIARAIDRAGTQLGQNEPTLAEYASRFAGNVGNLATRLREGSIEELIEDTRRLARRNPALFLAGGVALGFALSRFIKASAERGAYGDEFSAARAPTLTDEVDDLTATVDITASGRGAAAVQSNGG